MYSRIALKFYIIFCLVKCFLSAESHWNYEDRGPDVWKDMFSSCGGQSQSPINIKTECTIYQSFTPFQFSSGYSAVQNFKITNNGHTLVAQQTDPDMYPLTITQGGLNGTFKFVNFHLHWGENYNSGSEHQLNGQKFAGEVHFVHTNADINQNAVLGMFMQSTPVHNNSSAGESRTVRQATTNDMPITDHAASSEWQRYLLIGNQTTKINDSGIISLNLSLLINTNFGQFYRYAGSLTTPPCSENVVWTVFDTPIQFSEIEFGRFRSQIYFKDYRGPQPTHDRTVYRSFPNATVSPISDYHCCANTEKHSNTSKISSNGYSIVLMNQKSLLFYYLFFYLITVIY